MKPLSIMSLVTGFLFISIMLLHPKEPHRPNDRATCQKKQPIPNKTPIRIIIDYWYNPQSKESFEIKKRKTIQKITKKFNTLLRVHGYKTILVKRDDPNISLPQKKEIADQLKASDFLTISFQPNVEKMTLKTFFTKNPPCILEIAIPSTDIHAPIFLKHNQKSCTLTIYSTIKDFLSDNMYCACK
ncbi:MAG: hypothetical protein V1855_05280 [bacterium]